MRTPVYASSPSRRRKVGELAAELLALGKERVGNLRGELSGGAQRTRGAVHYGLGQEARGRVFNRLRFVGESHQPLIDGEH